MSAITVAATSQGTKMSDCRGYESRLFGSSMGESREKEGQSLCVGNKASQFLWRRNMGGPVFEQLARRTYIASKLYSKKGASQSTI